MFGQPGLGRHACDFLEGIVEGRRAGESACLGYLALPYPAVVEDVLLGIVDAERVKVFRKGQIVRRVDHSRQIGLVGIEALGDERQRDTRHQEELVVDHHLLEAALQASLFYRQLLHEGGEGNVSCCRRLWTGLVG